jgi:hypothetical protein
MNTEPLTLTTLTHSSLGIALLSGAALILVFCIVLAFYTYRLHRRLSRFLITTDAETITDSLQTLAEAAINFEHFQNETTQHLLSINSRLRRSIQGIHTVRFNPFSGTGSGGNQSFATAFLNEDGHGVIISTVFSRERTSVYAKPVSAHQSPFELSLEEQEALDKARLTVA